MAAEGLRVLSVAFRILPEGHPLERDVIERECVFVGFVGIRDPPREGVSAAIEVWKK